MEGMAKVIIDTDDGSRRRLPTWMQSNDTSKKERLGNLDELCSTSGKQIEARDGISMIESMSSEVDVVLAEKRKDSVNKETFAKNYSKKNTRKPKRGDGSKDSTSNSGEGKFEGEVIEHGKSIDTQSMKLKGAKRNYVKVLLTEDEAELTVEDLISIAEEFLTSNKEMQHEQSVTRKSESSQSNSIPTNSSESSIAHGGKLNGTIRSCQVLSKCTQTSSSHLNKFDKKQTEESATFSSNKIKQSGDAAQDMLELFLGPLLKNAPPKEPDPEITRELLTSTYESDSLVRSFVDVEKQAPLMKKKSSFKDKVAMFF